VEDTPLLKSDAFSIYKRLAMKKIISREKIKRNSFTYLELYTRQSCLVNIPLTEVNTPYLDHSVPVVCYFSLVFSESYHLASSSKKMVVTSFHFDLQPRKS